ncbi:cell-division initiation protein [Thermoclostridium stercorarium subsp. stercorarium DSM 8532]|jgi:cell division initiation protein|uniref:Cell-division initiation protein n=3 Tax=Thermoclostridium stercorarium TaxID=1510 RepID=L7VQ63_THES1|nr:DivIVA domain-containing protein [Thermoclostridium stercorarium]AGC68566.1 cell-division initiation protein [Thermoclostridium stercorarium subsp. stercorarium DSM 8532]AGI39582.1 cell division initiation protein [Thermoclostridium stercorarium subsp. stercorarium DSM 8532]ANW98916.1 cell division protein DivIVA [Thermoclostridium stercorarium subsp. thermolacticum DSM 2910]ANX01443.1 cell division protein DivIVA [Thermoclostridium stercorarium subsp. leptospartum DSM 9219]UZQ84553.1 DivIV
MNFTPNDLSNIVFRRSVVRGVDENQVYEVIQKIIEDYSDYIRELMKAKEQVMELKDRLAHYEKMEDTLKKSLILAQQSSSEIISNAEKKAENIIAEAQNKAKEIIDEANREVVKIQFEAERLKKDMAVYKSKALSLLQSQMKLLNEME